MIGVRVEENLVARLVMEELGVSYMELEVCGPLS